MENSRSLGSQEYPHTIAPKDWNENGVTYGAWCKCSRCGLVGRSTITFDFYADSPGEKLVCESCTTGAPEKLSDILNEAIELDDEGELPEE
jgi:hypothetical protein